MRVCIINNIYPPFDRGGAEQVVVKTVEGLHAAGHEVCVITTCPKGEYTENIEGVQIYRKKPVNIFFYTQAHNHSFFLRFFWHCVDMFNVGMVFWVWKIIQKEKPDVVHTHNIMGVSFLVPMLLRKMGIRHIHTVHDVQLVEPSAMILKTQENSWRYNGFPTKIYTTIITWLMGSPAVVISPSRFLRTFYSSRGFFQKSKMVVLRNPATFSLQKTEKGESVPHVFRFLYVGQIEEHKGVLLLTQAFQLVKQLCNIPCELHIVGSGSVLNRLKEENEKTGIIFHGRVDRNALSTLYKEMDVCVVPSLCYENSPTVIFESFAFGLPVIASNTEGVVELINEGKNGLVFETGNAEALAKHMAWCLTHVAEVQEIGKQTHTAVTSLSVEEYGKTLLSYYKSSAESAK